MENNFISVKDLTKAPWGFSQDQAYALVNAKGFPVTRVGRRYVIHEWELKEWFEKNKGKQVTPPRR